MKFLKILKKKKERIKGSFNEKRSENIKCDRSNDN